MRILSFSFVFLTFALVQALAVTTLTCTLPNTAQVGVAYTGASCVATGGTSPYAYAISVGTLPAGLTLNATTGAVTGTPSTAGSSSFTFRATDSSTTAQTATQAFTNFVVAPPTLTLTCTLPAAKVGVVYSGGSCTAGGGTPPYSFTTSLGALPAGLALNQTTGAVTGTPTAAGTSSFTLRVTDAGTTAQTATQVFTNFVVAPATLTLSCTASSQAIVGSPYSGSCAASGGTTPYTYGLTGTLPGGLSQNATTGAITGTPTAPGTSTVTVRVSDGGTQTASQPLTITVIAALNLTTVTLPNGVNGIAYSASCAATGGTPPYTFSISTGALPSGLTLNAANCAITGTPAAIGTFGPVLKVTDSGTPAQSDTQAISLIISPALTITTATVPNGSVGVPYSVSLAAQNGTAPYAWSISTGALPTGLSLNAATGVISGTPTAVGAYSFTVRVADSGSPAQSKTQAFGNVTIAAGLTITTSTLADGSVGTAYGTSITAQNGQTPYIWSFSAGALPPGLSLGATGAISGTPTTPGTFSFTAKVTDSTTPTAQSATQPLSITINGLTITTSSLGTATVGVPYSATLTAVNGVAPLTWTVNTGSTLPGGLSLSASGTLSGTPTAAGTFTFAVKAADSRSQTATQTLSLLINPGSGPTVPTFTFNGVPASQTPGQTISGASVAVSPVSSAAWPIVVTIAFTPNAAGVAAGYVDPAMQFVGSTGNKLSYSVTVPALATSVPLPQIVPGTVAGRAAIALVVQGQNGANSSFTVPASAPIINSGGVQILNVTSSGFNVEVVANSSPRDLRTATVTFFAASGAQITGTTTFTVDVSSVMSSWYSGAASQTHGSAFSLTLPFTFTGSSAAISSASVTLTNSVGTSAAVTGTK